MLISVLLGIVSPPAQAQLPVISKVNRMQGPPGERFAVEGMLENVVTVQVGGVDAIFFFGWYDTNGLQAALVGIVPEAAVTGPITVRTPEGSATTTEPFTVVSRLLPVVASYAPTSGAPGDEVKFDGTNLIEVLSVQFNGVEASSRQDGMLGQWYFAKVPTGATSGPITIRTRGGSFTTQVNFIVTPPAIRPPRIERFVPESGPPGTSVGFMGSNLLEVISVEFNGIPATEFGAGLAGSIYSAEVPVNATTGPITIRTRSGSYTTALPFVVTGFPPPEITSFSPESAAPGATITIHGHSLLRASAVLFNGVPATFSPDPMPPIDPRDVWPLTAIVPANATSGPITVVAPEGSSVSAQSFAVLPQPTIVGFDVEAGIPGTWIEILGSNLRQVSSVTVGDMPAVFTQDVTRLRFTVPIGAATGPVTVATAGGVAKSGQPFIVLSSGDPLEQWTWHGNIGTHIRGIDYGAGLFVAVGLDAIWTSPGGGGWTQRDSPVSDEWLDIAYGGGVFVAVGKFGKIVRSADGIIWDRELSGVESSPNSPSWRLTKVAYGRGGFVAVGLGGLVLASPDGSHWTTAVSGTTQNLAAVAYGNGAWVAGGQESTLIVSKDGLAWNPAPINRPFAILTDLVFGNGLFVGVGNGFTMTSSDGANWMRRDLPGDCFVFLHTIAFGAGQFVAVSENQGRTVVSRDGIDWSGTRMPIRELVYGLAFGAGRLVAAGDYGTLLSSPDGKTWQREPAGNSSSLFDVTFGPAGFVAVGSVRGWRDPRSGRSILVSQTGDRWEEATSFGSALDEDPIQAVTADASGYIAIGGAQANTIQVSTNGRDWAVNAALPADSAIAFGDGQYVSVGADGPLGGPVIATSTDRSTWVRQSAPTYHRLASVTFGRGLWVAVGDSGVILNSTNGREWKLVSSGIEPRLNRVTFGGDQFVAIGGNGTILSSPDGISWSARQSGVFENLYGLAYGAGNFVAAGGSGTILTSSDAATWTRRASGTRQYLFGVAYGNDTFVIVGDHGAILQSADTRLPLRFSGIRVSPASLQLRLIDERGRDFRIEASTNLTDWVELTKVGTSKKGLLSVETQPSEAPRCFYRAVVSGVQAGEQ